MKIWESCFTSHFFHRNLNPQKPMCVYTGLLETLPFIILLTKWSQKETKHNMKYDFRTQERNEKSQKTIRSKQGLYNSGSLLLGDEALTDQKQSAHNNLFVPATRHPQNWNKATSCLSKMPGHCYVGLIYEVIFLEYLPLNPSYFVQATL